MIKNLKVFANDNERAQAFSNGYYLKDSFTNTFDCYKKYKLNLLDDCTDNISQEMEVLSFLERLGFPMDQVGTIFYKNMIVKAIHHLDGFDDLGTSISREKLLELMKKPFSQFYIEVARNDLDIGIKTFHAHVQDSIKNIRYSNSDTALLFDVYSNFSKNTDYGEAALIIGAYIINNKNKDDTDDKAAIKQITMVPIKTKVSN